MFCSSIFVDTSEFYLDFMIMSDWTSLLSNDDQSQFSHCGYYRHDFYNPEQQTSLEQDPHNLVFLVLNTNLYYKTNFSGSEDPCGQLLWLDSQLTAATSDKRNRIFIVAHVPPGFFERDTSFGPFFQTASTNDSRWNDRYIDIITRHSRNPGVIVAHFYGHTHTDSFRLFKRRMDDIEPPYSKLTQSIGLALIAPSVVPRANEVLGTNPGIRLYEYHHSNSYMTNYQQYYFDLEEANHADGYWRELYSFTQAYNIDNMSVENMDKLKQSFASSNRESLKMYANYNTLGVSEKQYTCKSYHCSNSSAYKMDCTII